MIIVDATVLMYATTGAHRLRDPCRELIGGIADGFISATTTIGTIEEVVRLRARTFTAAEAAAVGRDYMELLTPLLTTTAKDLDDGLQLFEEQQDLSATAAILACCAKSAGISTIVSADTGFATVPGLIHVLPDRAGVASLS